MRRFRVDYNSEGPEGTVKVPLNPRRTAPQLGETVRCFDPTSDPVEPERYARVVEVGATYFLLDVDWAWENKVHSVNLNRHSAVADSLLHAHVDSYAECVPDCPNVDAAELLDMVFSTHKSTAHLVEGLGGRATGDSEECEHCHVPWPCPFVTEAVRSAYPLLDDWATSQPWYPQQPKPLVVLPEMSAAEQDDVVRCDYCEADVSEGVEQWRERVNAAYRYTRDYLVALDDWIEKPTGNAMGEEWDTAFKEGLHLARSIAGAQMNRVLFSHHAHLSFVLRERELGRIDRRILV